MYWVQGWGVRYVLSAGLRGALRTELRLRTNAGLRGVLCTPKFYPQVLSSPPIPVQSSLPATNCLPKKKWLIEKIAGNRWDIYSPSAVANLPGGPHTLLSLEIAGNKAKTIQQETALRAKNTSGASAKEQLQLTVHHLCRLPAGLEEILSCG